jgi:hypothetical protein
MKQIYTLGMIIRRERNKRVRNGERKRERKRERERERERR